MSLDSDVPGTTARPTHNLKDVKAGSNSVQLLVSTQDHVYDAESIEAGENSWQVIGSWHEASVAELAQCLRTRQASGLQTGRISNTQGSGRTEFGGVGRRLGDPRT